MFQNKIYLKELSETIVFKVDQSLNSRFIKFFFKIINLKLQQLKCPFF